MKYINYEAAIYPNAKTDDFLVKVAETVDEASKLIEIGLRPLQILMAKSYSENASKKITG